MVSVLDIGLVIVAIFVLLLVISLALKIIVNAFDGENKGFGSVFLTSIVVVIVSIALSFLGLIGFIIAFIVTLIILKGRHLKNYTQAFIAAIAWAVLTIIILFAISLAVGASIIAFLWAF